MSQQKTRRVAVLGERAVGKDEWLFEKRKGGSSPIHSPSDTPDNEKKKKKIIIILGGTE